MNRFFLHIDLDAFFASVEQLDHPEYRGKPVIVGGLKNERRGVVSTASYEARKYGVHSAMPLFQATRLCPNGIYLPVRMSRYHEKSEEVMAIFRNYSPDVQQMSVDEAFVDLTGTERLFGDPIETARKIKKEVLEKTGLTVSVGIASTKYVAKIASGLNKPDGFLVIPQGKETEFMLSLPLEKVWGAGTKTLQKLKSHGFKTTKDIYTHSEAFLQSLFGQATGSFLYNAVRGNEDEDFRQTVKNHSISSENTYPYDLTDKDAIESALYRLCYMVQFRALKEKVLSKTVSVKIRYEDFSTLSVQDTTEDAVSSTDNLFERVKNLFFKKYDNRKGIRLLGVCMMNVYPRESGIQGVLFNDMAEKKRKLENAIFEASQKNPAIKIQKASQLNKNIFVLLAASFLSLLSPAKTAAETTETKRKADGAAGIVFDTKNLPLSTSGKATSLFNYDFGDKNVEFLADGYWKTSVSESLQTSFGFDNAPEASFDTPVFVQNVDLTLWFMLNHKFYFEAAFADGFDKNTVALGYIGDGYLKSARIGNRKIIFPNFYSIDQISRGIGGGDNQAPGISLSWAGKKWKSDFVFRYDMIEAEEKTWYGNNSVTENNINLSDYNTGNQYVIPKELISSVKDIFVENASGSYEDSKGRKYRKLDQSQYILYSSGEILISRDGKAYKQDNKLPNVAVSFSKDFEAEVGSYDNASTFLGKVQAWFSTSKTGIRLKDYSENILGTVDGEKVLMIQSGSGFSPFISAYRYDSGLTPPQDAVVASKSTKITNQKYTASQAEIAAESFYTKKHSYTDIVISEGTYSSVSPEARFPLADIMPEIYLSSSSKGEYDFVLRLRTYTAVSRYDIGTKAIPGTVRVYKNGVIDSGATYDKESGTISLSSPASVTDHIFATWYKESSSRETGAFAAAAGFQYEFTKNLSADISASTRWTYADGREFSDASFSSPGFAALAQGIKYKNENLEVSNVISASLENENTTGNYRILGMDDSSAHTYYLTSSAGTNLPKNYAPSINLKDENSLNLDLSRKGSVSAKKGISDSGISGYAIPFSWDFSGIEETASKAEPFWSAETISMKSNSGLISNASNFSVAIKIPKDSGIFNLPNPDSQLKVYLQLGVEGTENFSSEESDLIPTWLISEDGSNIKRKLNLSASDWQIVTVTLGDEERARIARLGNYNGRIIVTYEGNNPNILNVSPAFYIGPYEATGLSFSIKTSGNDVIVTSQQTKDATLSASKIKSLNTGTNYVQKFDFKYTENSIGTENIRLTKFFKEIDFTNYEELHFWMNFEGANNSRTDLTFSFDRLKDDDKTETAVSFTIPSSELKGISGWNEVILDFDSKKVSVAGKSFPAIVDRKIIPTRFQIIAENTAHSKDETESLSIDEIYLSGNKAYFLFQDKLQAKYKKSGEIITIGDTKVLKDFSAGAKLSTAESVKVNDASSAENLTQVSGETAFTLMNFKIGLDLLKSSDTSGISSASHKISTDTPLFSVFSLTENYNYEKTSESLKKENSFALDFSKLNVPLRVSTEHSGDSNVWSVNQNAKGKINFSHKGFSLFVEGKENQKVPSSTAESKRKMKAFDTDNYFTSWKDITAFEFDTGSEKASKREIGLSAELQQKLDFYQLRPKIKLLGEGSYKNSTSVTFSDKISGEFSIPFTVKKNAFSLSYTKLQNEVKNTDFGGDYGTDTKEFFTSFSDKDWFMKSFIFADLFSDSLAEDIVATSRKNEASTISYSGTYGFTWKREFTATKYDFFVPGSFSFDFARKIEAAETFSDIYEITAKVTNTALNMFGRTGIMPVWRWYDQDEFYASLAAKLKIPKENPENTKVSVSGYLQANLLLNATDTLRSGIEGTIEGLDEYSMKVTSVYKHRAEKSLPTEFIRLFKKDIDYSNLKITKTESLNFGASRSSGVSELTHKLNIDFTHQLDIEITKFLTANSSIGANYSLVWDKIAKLGATVMLGATIKF